MLLEKNVFSANGKFLYSNQLSYNPNSQNDQILFVSNGDSLSTHLLYDMEGQMIQRSERSQGGRLLRHIVMSYNSLEQVIAKEYYNSDSALQYTDSLIYNISGQVERVNRWEASTGLIFYKTISYYNSKPSLEIHYHRSGSVFVETKALVYSYRNGLLDKLETLQVMNADALYNHTTRYFYSGANLVALSNSYDNGRQAVLLDSIKYERTSDGMPSKIWTYNGDRELEGYEEYTYENSTPLLSVISMDSPKLHWDGRVLDVFLPSKAPATLTFFKFNGQMSNQFKLNQSRAFELSQHLTPGNYIGVLRVHQSSQVVKIGLSQ